MAEALKYGTHQCRRMIVLTSGRSFAKKKQAAKSNEGQQLKATKRHPQLLKMTRERNVSGKLTNRFHWFRSTIPLISFNEFIAFVQQFHWYCCEKLSD
jgi:hypothetical protein